MQKSMLASLVDDGKLGGWVRAGVAAGITWAIAKYPPLGAVMDSGTQAALGAAAAGIVVGAWSHWVKS